MTWNTGDTSSTISRADALEAIRELAIEKGIRGKFKVLYNGSAVEPSDLPDQVDMTRVSVSEVMTQA